MFSKKISQNIDILARIHRNVFPCQPTIVGNKQFFFKFKLQISVSLLHLFFHNACPRYLKSRGDLLKQRSVSRVAWEHFRLESNQLTMDIDERIEGVTSILLLKQVTVKEWKSISSLSILNPSTRVYRGGGKLYSMPTEVTPCTSHVCKWFYVILYE